jgi:nitric oxide reductase NorQ protein
MVALTSPTETPRMNGTDAGIFYVETGRETLVFEQAWRSRLPLMIKGPTGCGKTRFVEYMAARLARPMVTVSCNEDTSATDLLGRHLIEGGDTRWVDGPVTRAVRTGAILYLDEIAEARPDALVVIHSITDYRRELFLDRTGERIVAPPEFMLVVSYNPGYQRSLRELKPSTRQRFVGLTFGFASEEQESEVVRRETGVAESVARSLVRLGRKIRNLSDLNLLEPASTRLLVGAGKLIAAGVPPRLACFTAISEPLTDDGDAQAAIRQVIELSM